MLAVNKRKQLASPADVLHPADLSCTNMFKAVDTFTTTREMTRLVFITYEAKSLEDAELNHFISM